MVVQTYLLRVVDLPDEGFPTKPIRGSLGIALYRLPSAKYRYIVEDCKDIPNFM